MGSKVFITGTDTEVGKTWSTVSVVRALREQSASVKALKPVACGLDDGGCNDDIEALLVAQNLNHAEQINRYRFALPAAPSQAAAAEGMVVDPSGLVRWCHEQSNAVETCLIEGVGGVMTPITALWLVSDWIEAMPDCEVWLVVGCKLGAINQSLLTLAKLEQINRSPTRIFFNATSPENNAWIQPVRGAIAPFIEDNCHVIEIQYLEGITL
ncbi:MAG: dethiobiotin synthase [Mariprofundus sp.]|nr:dethiobiotin synthase [Mariprofundus sp.]